MSPTRHAGRRSLLLLAKFALAALILGYLLMQVRQSEGMSRLVNEPKDWTLLAAGFGCTFAAITLSFVRWRMLVTALGIDFPLSDALRLGSLGFMLNFVTLGTLGGDLFKAVFIARDRPGQRTEAVATVVADRLLGLITMMVLASVGIVAADLLRIAPPALALFCKTILAATWR
jgi:Na+/phosphate symporter